MVLAHEGRARPHGTLPGPRTLRAISKPARPVAFRRPSRRAAAGSRAAAAHRPKGAEHTRGVGRTVEVDHGPAVLIGERHAQISARLIRIDGGCRVPHHHEVKKCFSRSGGRRSGCAHAHPPEIPARQESDIRSCHWSRPEPGAPSAPGRGSNLAVKRHSVSTGYDSGSSNVSRFAESSSQTRSQRRSVPGSPWIALPSDPRARLVVLPERSLWSTVISVIRSPFRIVGGEPALGASRISWPDRWMVPASRGESSSGRTMRRSGSEPNVLPPEPAPRAPSTERRRRTALPAAHDDSRATPGAPRRIRRRTRAGARANRRPCSPREPEPRIQSVVRRTPPSSPSWMTLESHLVLRAPWRVPPHRWCAASLTRAKARGRVRVGQTVVPFRQRAVGA